VLHARDLRTIRLYRLNRLKERSYAVPVLDVKSAWADTVLRKGVMRRILPLDRDPPQAQRSTCI